MIHCIMFNFQAVLFCSVLFFLLLLFLSSTDFEFILSFYHRIMGLAQDSGFARFRVLQSVLCHFFCSLFCIVTKFFFLEIRKTVFFPKKIQDEIDFDCLILKNPRT